MADWLDMPQLGPVQLPLFPDDAPPALSVWERMGMWMLGECEWPGEGPEPGELEDDRCNAKT